MSIYPHPRPIMTCAFCSTPFQQTRSLQAECCSRTCSNRLRAQRQEISARVEIKCDHCGTFFTDFVSKKARFCSRPCWNAHPHPRPIEARFHKQVRKTETCWWWTGGLHMSGYGRIRITGEDTKRKLAHVLAWEIASGAPVPKGMFVLHVCDNRACVRADTAGTYEVDGEVLPRFGHLFLGTTKHNVRDAVSKGRQVHGERSWAAKLTEDNVRTIRRSHAAGVKTGQIHLQFPQVKRVTLNAILARRNWKGVE